MKFKYIISFAFIIVCISVMNSCKKDPLDIAPDGRITIKDVFDDETNTKAYLNTVYSQIPSYFISYGGIFSFLAAVTDDAKESQVTPSNTFGSWITGGLTPSYDPLMAYYSNYWTGIRYANTFLMNIDKANISNPANKSRMKAEARVLRAFYYWELIKEYGPMPIITAPLDVSYNFSSLKRPTFQQNVNFIVNECDSAIANPDLPMRITQATNRGRVTKAVALAIESEATLFNASPLWNPDNNVVKWRRAAMISNKALDSLTANGQYKLFPDYGDYFLNRPDISTSPNDRETIFALNGTGGIQLVPHNDIPGKSGSVKAGSGPSQELVDSYEMQATGEPAITGYVGDDHVQPVVNLLSGYNPDSPYVGRDPRFYATVWYNGAAYDNVDGNIHTIETYLGGTDELTTAATNVANTHTGYYLRKFIDSRLQEGQSSSATWKIFRLAEIYLNLAEAENEAYNGPDALAYYAINAVRERVNMPRLPEGLNQAEFRKRVRNERRVEFAFEGKRFWDVRRWKILDSTGRLVTGMEITKDGASFNYKRFIVERRNAWKDKYLIFPIPVSDASDIPDFAKHQNPGW